MRKRTKWKIKQSLRAMTPHPSWTKPRPSDIHNPLILQDVTVPLIYNWGPSNGYYTLVCEGSIPVLKLLFQQ